jgi:hypothetical protein
MIGFIVVSIEVNIHFMFRTLIFTCIYPVFLIVFSRKGKTIITNAQNISMHKVGNVCLNEHNDLRHSKHIASCLPK